MRFDVVTEAYRVLAGHGTCWWQCNIVHGYYEGTGLIAIDTDTVACSKCVAAKKKARKGWFSGDDALEKGDHHCYNCWDKEAPVEGTESNRFIKHEMVLTDAGKGMRKGFDKGSVTNSTGVYTRQFALALVRGHSSSPGASEANVATHVPHAPMDVDDWQPPAEKTPTPELLKLVGKVHVQCGHPSSSALARAIRVTGGSDESVAAAYFYRCPVCPRRQAPGPAPTLSLHDDIKDCWDKEAPVEGTESNRFIKHEMVLTDAGKGMRKGFDKGSGSGKSDDGKGFDKGKDFDKSSGSGKSDDGKGFDKGSGKSDSGKGFHWRDDGASQGQGLPLTHTLTGLPLTPASRTPARAPASRTPARASIDSGKGKGFDSYYVVKGTGKSDDGKGLGKGSDTGSIDRSRSPQRLTRTQKLAPSEIYQWVATERPSSEDIENTIAYLSEVLAVRSRR